MKGVLVQPWRAEGHCTDGPSARLVDSEEPARRFPLPSDDFREPRPEFARIGPPPPPRLANDVMRILSPNCTYMCVCIETTVAVVVVAAAAATASISRG